MAVRVIHSGWDDCYRLAVLRRVGYEVTEAGNLAELLGELRATGHYDAVVVSEDAWMDLGEVLAGVRNATNAPVILFRGTQREIDGHHFELVIDRSLAPDEWLRAIALAIDQYRVKPRSGAPGSCDRMTRE